MKNLSNHLVLALFLAFISQSIQAQFDDIYYDPDRNAAPYNTQVSPTPTRDDLKDSGDEYRSYNPQESSYDDEYGEWENQDYYYTSRIKRFHRPVYGFGFYDPFYTDYYYYDPYEFNPWYYDRDIYSSSWRFYASTGPVFWSFRPYWSYWDYCNGWYGWPYSRWNYYSYYQPYYHYGGYYHGHDHHDRWYDRPDNDRYHYGSRKFGLTNTSKRGPVRLSNPSPRVITETTGVHADPGRTSLTPRRTVRSADGSPSNELQPDRGTNRPSPYQPKTKTDSAPSGEKNSGGRSGKAPRRNYSDYSPDGPAPNDEFKEGENRNFDRFRPHRSSREYPNSSYQNPPRERSYQTPSMDDQKPRLQESSRNRPSDQGGFKLQDLFKSEGSKSSSGDKSSKSERRESSRKSSR